MFNIFNNWGTQDIRCFKFVKSVNIYYLSFHFWVNNTIGSPKWCIVLDRPLCTFTNDLDFFVVFFNLISFIFQIQESEISVIIRLKTIKIIAIWTFQTVFNYLYKYKVYKMKLIQYFWTFPKTIPTKKPVCKRFQGYWLI